MNPHERENRFSMTPREIFERLDRFVIGQERAKRVVALGAYNHFKRIAVSQGEASLLKKSNVLLIGPTGCGKTHLARNLAESLNLPFVVVDATEYTEAGYYGKDVEVMIAELLYACNQNIQECERGIIFIDEIDKIARRSGGMRTGAGARDIGGEGVQQGLLKLLEGRRVFVPLNVTQHWNKHDFVEVDTSNILFICAGTFTDVQVYENAPIGFENRENAAKTKRGVGHKQLLEYGMIAELLGRLPVVVQLDELSREDLVRILVEPPDSLVREYSQLLACDDVRADFRLDGLEAMAEYAIKRDVGARGLRTIMEETMHEVMFDAPEISGRRIVVDRAFVEGKVSGLDSKNLDP